MPYGTRPGWRSDDSWSHGDTSGPRQFRFWPKHDLAESGWWIQSFWPFTPSKPSNPMGGTTTDILSSPSTELNISSKSSPSSAEDSPSSAEGSPSSAEGSPSSAESTLANSFRDSTSSTEAADIMLSTYRSALSLSCSSSGCLLNDLAEIPAVGIRKRKPGGDTLAS